MCVYVCERAKEREPGRAREPERACARENVSWTTQREWFFESENRGNGEMQCETYSVGEHLVYFPSSCLRSCSDSVQGSGYRTHSRENFRHRSRRSEKVSMNATKCILEKFDFKILIRILCLRKENVPPSLIM